MKQGHITLNVVDGKRAWFPPKKILVRVWRDKTRLVHERHYDANSITLTFQVHDNSADQFRALVFANGHVQSGFHPINLAEGKTIPVDLMLISKNADFDFADARLDRLPTTSPRLFELLKASNAFANLPRVDRVFGFAEPQLIQDIRAAGGQFSEQRDPDKKGHPGATCSFKQKLFGEANVQFTFHEKDKDANGMILVETDMDLFADEAAHIILEGIPNFFFRTKTDPKRIYILRWIAARQHKLSFDPPYTLTV
jgi:hypothetical protein